ncbi:hypothetical protein KC325_g95 [Hortaea werneckii]|nr:hypothetical protein KC325_g95 [Hortaea werneckii]
MENDSLPHGVALLDALRPSEGDSHSGIRPWVWTTSTHLASCRDATFFWMAAGLHTLTDGRQTRIKRVTTVAQATQVRFLLRKRQKLLGLERPLLSLSYDSAGLCFGYSVESRHIALLMMAQLPLFRHVSCTAFQTSETYLIMATLIPCRDDYWRVQA